MAFTYTDRYAARRGRALTNGDACPRRSGVDLDEAQHSGGVADTLALGEYAVARVIVRSPPQSVVGGTLTLWEG